MLQGLIVEDNIEFLNLLMEVLRAAFPAIQLSGVASAEQALSKIEQMRHDFVILDIKLPGMSGLELARTLRRRFGNIRIVVLTSYDTREYREAAAKCNADQFLVKGSSTLQEVIESVRAILVDLPSG